MANKAQNSEEVRQTIFDIFEEVDAEKGTWQESTSETANSPEPKFQEVEIDGDTYDCEVKETQTTDETDYDENEEYFDSDEQQAIEDELDNLIEQETQFTSPASPLNIYAAYGYKSKAQFLAEKLKLTDNRGNTSISALFRHLIDQELSR